MVNLVVAAAQAMQGIEPVAGKVEAAQLSKVRSALDAMAAGHARPGGLDGCRPTTSPSSRPGWSTR